MNDQLKAALMQGVAKSGRRYECVVVTFRGIELGRIFPRPLELSLIKETMNKEK